jgi:hypothetical protein
MTLYAYADPLFDPGGAKMREVVTTVTVRQAEFMHDAAIITLRGSDMSSPTLQPGTPVMMNYGWYNTRIDTFYGYIDHIESSFERNTPEAAHYHDVVCLGASYIMKDAFLGAWSSIKASDLVQQMALRYMFATLVEVDDVIWPQLSSPGQSAWSFLVSMAQKLGYSMSCNKTLLRFTSVDQALKQNWATMPIFQNQRSNLNTHAYESLVSFQALQGEATGLNGNRSLRLAGGIDPRNGQVIKVSNDPSTMSTMAASVPPPFFSTVSPDVVINEQGQGNASLAGLAQQNRFHYQACAGLTGDPSIVQGMPIVLTGLGRKDDGAWWVQEVVHKFRVSAYTMDVLLGRDSSGDNNARPNASYQTVYSPTNPLTLALAASPPTILVGNRWRSQSQAVTQVVA